VQISSQGGRVTFAGIEPGQFRAGFGGARMHHSREIGAYADTVGPTRTFVNRMDGTRAPGGVGGLPPRATRRPRRTGGGITTTPTGTLRDSTPTGSGNRPTTPHRT
jgi:hypothetical protein